jgi:hypothetical protein
MADLKTVILRGEAAQSMGGTLSKRGGGRRNTKKNQEGGAAELRGVSSVMNVVKGVESTSSIASTAASAISSSWSRYPEAAPVPPRIQLAPSHIPATPNQSAAPTQQGGVKHVKVELKKKAPQHKVHLKPKKADAPKPHAATKRHNTRKVRRVSFGLAKLHKRITHAKKLHKTMKEMPIDKLKEKLIKNGLIKANSKAPEAVLRQIASDAEVVAKKAL